MNYVRVMGGLGNQLFQYVFSKYVEKKAECPVLLDFNFFNYVKDVQGATVRNQELDKLNTHYVSITGDVACSQIVDEYSFTDDILRDELIYFNGYWQDKRYYEAVKNQIIGDLKIRNQYIDQEMISLIGEMANTNSVSVHIRRSDYLTGQNAYIFTSLSESYYSKALDIIKNTIGSSISLFVFSDDESFAKKLMDSTADDNWQVMPMRSAYQDMYLMTMCKHHIIANSSFSWWGAVLGEEGFPEGITVAPKAWYKDRQNPNLYFDRWLTL
jgi:hypothetical protein